MSAAWEFSDLMLRGNTVEARGLPAPDETSPFARMGPIKALAARSRFGHALPHWERTREIAPSGRIEDAVAGIQGT